MKSIYLVALVIFSALLSGCGNMGNVETEGPNEAAIKANEKMVDDAAKSGKRTAVADLKEEVAK